MVANSEALRNFDLFLKKSNVRTIICDLYWKSPMRVYDIALGDVVHFEYDDDQLDDVGLNLTNLLHITVYSNGEEKKIHEATGISLIYCK